MLPPIPDSFRWTDESWGPALRCRALEAVAPHLFTTRQLQLTSDADWQRVAAAVGAAHVATLTQVHGRAVVVVREAPDGKPEADVLVGDNPDVALAVRAADCVPLLIADRATGAVAAAHAGWRGLAAGVPGIAVRAMRDAFATTPANVVAAIGPSICADNYEVDAAVRSGFEAAGATERQLARWFLPGRRDAHWQFDGWQSAIDQLVDAGVPRTQIHAARLCTAAHAQLCSYRRDGKGAGRIAAAIRAR